MDKNTGEVLLKLQETINSWTQEVTQTRSALTKSLAATGDTVKPAFSLLEPAAPVQERPEAAAGEMQTESGEDTSQELVETNEALMRHVEELEMRVVEAERGTEETERERARLESEIEFAREQLHLRNKSAQDAEERRIEYEMQAEGAAQALGGSELEIVDLRQQLRSKDWRLLKTRNVLDMLREDHARRLADIEALSSEVEALRTEVEGRQASEGKTLSSLDESQQGIQELETALEQSRQKADQLTHDLEAAWEELNGSTVQLQEARQEIALLIAERDDHGAAAADFEEQVRSMAAREQAHEELVTRSGALSTELEEALASKMDENALLKDELAESRSAPDARMGELKEAGDAFAKLQVDFDELMSSNVVLRDDVKELKARLVDREQILGEARRELEQSEGDRQDLLQNESAAASRIEALSVILEEKAVSLEEGRQRLREKDSATAERIRELRAALEQEDAALEMDRQELLDKEGAAARQIEELRAALDEKTQAYQESQRAHDELSEKMSAREQLEAALRDEVASLRDRQPESVDDVEATNTALKEELESMRQVAVERDFVVHHAEAEVASMSRREAETEDALRQALEASKRMLTETVGASKTQQALQSELGELRAQSQEKDTAMRELRDELKVLRERVADAADTAPPSEDLDEAETGGPQQQDPDGHSGQQVASRLMSLDEAMAKLEQIQGGPQDLSKGGLRSRLKRMLRLAKPDPDEGGD